MPGHALKPSGQGTDSGLRHTPQIRQHPGQSLQLLDSQGCQQQKQQKQEAESHADTDGSGDSSGQAEPLAEKPDHRLRQQRQPGAQQKGQQQRQQILYPQPKAQKGPGSG